MAHDEGVIGSILEHADKEGAIGLALSETSDATEFVVGCEVVLFELSGKLTAHQREAECLLWRRDIGQPVPWWRLQGSHRCCVARSALDHDLADARKHMNVLVAIEEIRFAAHCAEEAFNLIVDLSCDCSEIELAEIGGAHQCAERAVVGECQVNAQRCDVGESLEFSGVAYELRKHGHAADGAQTTLSEEVNYRGVDAWRDAEIVSTQDNSATGGGVHCQTCSAFGPLS